MEIVTSRSSTKQPAKLVGPTVTLLNLNETVTTERDDQGNDHTVYTYTQYRLEAGEYELIAVGTLPSGAVWDENLRAIEREARYNEADKYLMKYTSYAPDNAKASAWTSYKLAVHDTVSQKKYPGTVTYPSRPE